MHGTETALTGKEYHNSYSLRSCLCFLEFLLPVLHLNTKCCILFISILGSKPLVCFVTESGDIEHQSCICAVVWHCVKRFVWDRMEKWLLRVKDLIRLHYLGNWRFCTTLLPPSGHFESHISCCRLSCFCFFSGF